MIHKLTFFTLIFLTITGCTNNKKHEKGFTIQTNDSLQFNDKIDTRFIIQPSGILATKNPEYKITPLFKLNYDPNIKSYYLGTTDYYKSYEDYDYDPATKDKLNNWNQNIIPGFRATYGYNWVNISVYNTKLKQQKELFKSPVLIKTLYYPSVTSDTLNGKPVTRNYMLLSVYDEDTNKDNKINLSDLRRFYLYDESGIFIKNIVPKNYNVFKSIYDKTSDYLYVYARFDENKNGKSEDTEPIKVFYINLKNPEEVENVY